MIIYATGVDAGLIPFTVKGKNDVTLADKFGASAENNFQMIEPKTLWGLHVNDMPNFYANVSLTRERFLATKLQESETAGIYE